MVKTHIKQLSEENSQFRKTLDFVAEQARKKAKYYDTLVWWARSRDPLVGRRPDVLKELERDFGKRRVLHESC
jgi:hypothetical protein